MNLRVLAAAATALLPVAATAQSAAEHIVLGDRARAALNAEDALRHYQEAITADPANAEALWRAAGESIDLGEFNDAARDSLYRLGEQYARRAVQADPKSSMAHFALAKALGRRALSLGARERVKFAGEVRREAMEALALDSTNAGALHVMGRWHANIMRLSGVSRFFARNLLGGRVFNEANWKDAEGYLERAAALEPDRIIHRLELASVYGDTNRKDRARELYQEIARMPEREFNDQHYQRLAAAALRDLR